MRTWLCLLFVLLVVGCSDSESGTDTDMSSSDMASDMPTVDMPAVDMPASDMPADDMSSDMPDDMTVSDMSDMGSDMMDMEADMAPTGCAAATVVTENNGLWTGSGAIDAPGVRHYFQIEPGADNWIIASFAVDDDQAINMTMALRDTNGQQLAKDTAAAFNNGRILYRTANTDPICIEIAETTDFEGGTGTGTPDDTFAFQVLAVNGSESEPNDDLASADDLPVTNDVGNNRDFDVQVLGEFETGMDDWFTFQTNQVALRLAIELYQQGPDANGSDTPLGDVYIYDAGGNVLSHVDATNGMFGLSVPMTETNGANDPLYVRVVPPAQLGANPFYTLQFTFANGDNEFEANEAANNNAGTPDVATPFGGIGRNYFFQGNLPANDIDHWSFDLTAAEVATISCSGVRIGSGIDAMNVQLLDPAQQVVQQETETVSADLTWRDGGSMPAITAGSTGTYLLRIASGGDLAAGSKNYQCGVQVAP